MIWSKIYHDKWLYGSIRQYRAEIRSVWPDLQCMAGSSAFTGKVCITEKMGYEHSQLAKLFNCSDVLIAEALMIFASENYISIDENNVITITDWKIYQNEYQRLKEYRGKTTRKGTKKGTANDTSNDTRMGTANDTESASISISNSNSESNSNTPLVREFKSINTPSNIFNLKGVEALEPLIPQIEEQYKDWKDYCIEKGIEMTQIQCKKIRQHLRQSGAEKAKFLVDRAIRAGSKSIWENRDDPVPEKKHRSLAEIEADLKARGEWK